LYGFFWEGQFKGKFSAKGEAQKIFEQYIEDVKAYVPNDRLLVYNVSEGWEPLCNFLDLPMPNEKFPHLKQEGRL